MVQSIVLGVLPIVVSRLLERGRLIQLKEIVNNRAKRAEEIYSTTYGTVVLEYLYCTLSYGVLRECRNTVHIIYVGQNLKCIYVHAYVYTIEDKNGKTSKVGFNFLVKAVV